MADKIPQCQDAGQGKPGCEEVADLEYTMRFDDIGQPPLYWCEPCGKAARAMDRVLGQAFEERGSEFIGQFADAIEAAEGTRH